MPDALPPNLVTELRASAHLMLLDAGVYCIHHMPGSAPPDATTGLPGARISLPPGVASDSVAIAGFRDDGWLGAPDSAALIRVSRGPAQVLMTIYQDKNSQHEAPKLQVTRLLEGAPAPTNSAARPTAPGFSAPGFSAPGFSAPGFAAPGFSAPGIPPQPQPAPIPTVEPEMAAHVQARGDVVGRLGDWLGDRLSGRWMEGFALSPRRLELAAEDIEYQAVLGRGWLSPWAEAGQFCGSRGMALPILGLRVRLRGQAAETHGLQVSATFTDGTAIGPVGSGEACEAESLSPLEAFCVTLVPKVRPQAAAKPAKPTAQTQGGGKPAPGRGKPAPSRRG